MCIFRVYLLYVSLSNKRYLKYKHIQFKTNDIVWKKSIKVKTWTVYAWMKRKENKSTSSACCQSDLNQQSST